MFRYTRPFRGSYWQSSSVKSRCYSSTTIIQSKKERLKDLREKLSQDDAAGSSFGPSTTSRSRPPMQTTNGLENVKHVIAVTSCKGGVGKSTIATNLAFTLKKMGISVGLLDADVYGPSLPSIVQPEDARLLKTESGRIRPVDFEGVPCMSFGWSTRGGSAAALRGPIVSGLVTQLATGTDWGSLDVLLVDMPPGTGDVHITLGQQVQMSAAIVVTTPQRLSLVDVVRGIDLLHTFHVPAIALVENMLYFECDHGTRYNIFGPSVAEAITAQYGIPHTFGLPIDAAVAAASNEQLPLPLCDAQGDAVKQTLAVYEDMAHRLLREVVRVLVHGVCVCRLVPCCNGGTVSLSGRCVC
eukprot:m.489360 g.489360  ORF g.489360 m.489360 type:complete len:355 (+) comp21765_c0_seq8:178-1242(+)